MKTQKKILIMLGVAVLVVLLVLNFNFTGESILDAKEINIGAILPLSGNAAYYGERAQNGIEIAREEIESKFPDLDFKIYYGDSAYIPKQGVNEYMRLQAAQGLDGVITAASHVSLAIMPLTREDNILQMAIFSSADKYSTPDDLTFRVSTRNEIESLAMAEFIDDEGYDKIGVIYLDNDFGIGFKEDLVEYLDNKNIDVVLEESISLDTTDFQTILIKMQKQGSDAIFMVGLAPLYAQILKQSKELGIETDFLAMRSAEDPVLIRNAGELAEGLVYTYPFDSGSNNKVTQSFTQRFEEKYNVSPDAYAAEGYEGFKITALAFAECGKDYECVQSYITNLRAYDSVFGELSYDNNGDVYYEFFPKIVENGEFISFQ